MSQKNKTVLIALNNAFVTDKSLAGGDRLLMGIYSHLPKGNFILQIILPQVGFSHWQKLKLSNVDFHVLPPTMFDNRQSRPGVFMAYLMRIIPCIRRLILTTKNNIPTFIYTSSDYFVDVLPAWGLKLCRPSLRWYAQTYHIISPPYRRPGSFLNNLVAYLMQRLSLQLIIRFADHVFADNPTTLKYLNRHAPTVRCSLLSGGIDVSKRSRYRPKKVMTSDAILVSRLDPTKNIPDAIDIWKCVTHNLPHSKLLIIGSSTPKRIQEVHNLINTAGLSKSITVLDFIPYESSPNILDFIKNSRLFLFLETEGGVSLSLLEALVMGVPVVAYPHSVFSSGYIKEGIVICEPSIKSMSQKIVQLIKNPDQCKKLSIAAVKQAHKFDWQKQINSFLLVIKKDFTYA